MIDWSAIFDEAYPLRGATEAEIGILLDSVTKPISAREITTINRSQRNPFPKSDPLYSSYRPFDPTLWRIPQGSLPKTYLELLRWSNGGEFRTGERWFQMVKAQDVRPELLAYHVPQYMPGVLPFAWNGGSILYLFDMRQGAENDEYPILCCHSSNLGFGKKLSPIIATSFLDVCRGSVNVDDLIFS